MQVQGHTTFVRARVEWLRDCDLSLSAVSLMTQLLCVWGWAVKRLSLLDSRRVLWLGWCVCKGRVINGPSPCNVHGESNDFYLLGFDSFCNCLNLVVEWWFSSLQIHLQRNRWFFPQISILSFSPLIFISLVTLLQKLGGGSFPCKCCLEHWALKCIVHKKLQFPAFNSLEESSSAIKN